jgi:hypothetical protein
MHWGFLLSYLLHSEFFKVFQTMRSLFQERQVGDSNKYNDCIQHETLRVAVCDIIEDESFCYPALRLQVAIFVFSYYSLCILRYLSLKGSCTYQSHRLFCIPIGDGLNMYIGAQYTVYAKIRVSLIFREVMTRSFPEFYDYYISVTKEKSFLNGKQMQVSHA